MLAISPTRESVPRESMESMLNAQLANRLHQTVAASLGQFIAQMQTEVQVPDAQAVPRAEARAFATLANPKRYGCTKTALPNAKSMLTDVQLQEALENLADALDACELAHVHGNLDSESVRVPVDGSAGWSPNDSDAWRWQGHGSAAADVGGILASILLVAVEQAHRADAPPPAAPTWPPAPPSTRSPAHTAAHDIWHAYVATRGLPGAESTAELLRLTAGYAGCLILCQTIQGAASFARLSDDESRAAAEKCALAVGRELVIHSQGKLAEFDGVLTILDTNLNSNKHAMPETFSIFSDLF